MVDPKHPRRVDSIALRRVNDAVAARQPFAAPVAKPVKLKAALPASKKSAHSATTTPPASSRPTGPVAAITATPKPRFSRRFKLFAALIPSLMIAGSALAFVLHGQLHNKFSAASIVVSAAKAATTQTAQLQGQTTGRTNFLIYGMTKDGLRTDSIMLASYYYQQKKLVTLNIPRDLYVYDGYESVKMGEVYAYAKNREPNNPQYPDQFVAQLIAKEYGIPVDYWVELNMQGEVSLVNDIGGIDVNVPDSFTDYEYPTDNYSGYIRPAPHFTAGEQHMDGDTALIFSRSRHSLDNSEGSDFARSKRQGLVLQAILTKVKAQGILGNLAQLGPYLSLVNKNVSTNMSTDEMLAAAALVKGINPATDHLIGNWSTGNGFLCDSSTAAGSYITVYGVSGDCKPTLGEAGIDSTSTYRAAAVSYVQNLLQSVSPPPAAATSSTSSSATTPATTPSVSSQP